MDRTLKTIVGRASARTRDFIDVTLHCFKDCSRQTKNVRLKFEFNLVQNRGLGSNEPQKKMLLHGRSPNIDTYIPV